MPIVRAELDTVRTKQQQNNSRKGRSSTYHYERLILFSTGSQRAPVYCPGLALGHMLNDTIHGDKHLVWLWITILVDILQACLSIPAALRVRFGLKCSCRYVFGRLPKGGVVFEGHTHLGFLGAGACVAGILFGLGWGGHWSTVVPLPTGHYDGSFQESSRPKYLFETHEMIELVVAGALLVDGRHSDEQKAETVAPEGASVDASSI